MKRGKFIFGVLFLAAAMAACSDPTGPRLPEGEGDPPPPSNALIVSVEVGRLA